MTRLGKVGVGLAVIGLGALFVFPGCGTAPNVWENVEGGPTKVVAAFPPLYCFAKSVAGPDAAVLCLLETVGPHDFHPEKLDALKLRGANLFLVNGLGVDDWVPRMVTDSHNTRLKVVKVGEAIPEDKLLPGEEEDEQYKKHEPEKGGHEHHGLFDGHVWLGVPQAVVMVDRIRDALKKEDPGHAADFDKRARDYVGQLHELEAYGKKKLAGKKNLKIVSMHDSLRYFAHTFGLKVVASIQPQPGVEADPVKLAQLAKVCEQEKVRVIAVEPQFSPATAETLRRQLKSRGFEVHIVEVDPMETADPPLAADHYVRTMRANIDALASKLQ
jgi:ABC-type Zn uptake system ZnuABC Zn-binding protein ZnuA